MGNRFESPSSGETTNTDAELKDFLLRVFDTDDRTRAMSTIDEISSRLRYYASKGWNGVRSGSGVPIRPDQLVESVKWCKDEVLSRVGELKAIADDADMADKIDEIAANGGVTNTLGIRDAVVRALVDEVKNRRLMSR